MSYVNAGDPRAHTSPIERDRHARELVNKARGLILEDQPPGVEACNECAAITLLLAVGDLIDQIKHGPLEEEMLGTAQALDIFCRIANRAARDLRETSYARGVTMADMAPIERQEAA